jgi:hypothetical protein
MHLSASQAGAGSSAWPAAVQRREPWETEAGTWRIWFH